MASERIAILMHSMLPGGAQYRVIWLANRFVELGREVDLLLVNDRGDSGARLDPRVRVTFLAGATGNPTGPRSWLTIIALARYLRRVRPAVLMSGVNLAHAVAMRGSRLAASPVPVVLRLCSKAKHWPRDWSLAAIRRRLWGRDEMLYGGADGLIAVSRSTADDFQRISSIKHRPIDIIYNATATNDLLDRPLRVVRPPPRKATILSAGTLYYAKDFTTLIRAFALVHAVRPARLVILGEGEDRALLAALIAELGLTDDVTMPGWSTDVASEIERADVVVSTSLFEGLQATLIEALALGCQVVATDCPGGSREILDDGRLGWLVPVGDPEAVAAAIIAALDDPVDRRRLRAGAGRFAEDGKAEAYLRLFDRLRRHGSDLHAIA